MSDPRNVDDLSLEELEILVADRRREERERAIREAEERGIKPLRLIAEERATRRVKKTAKPKNWRDRALLVVEIVAVLGLVVIIVTSLLNLDTLNQEVAQVRSGNSGSANPQPTGVLPGSSFPLPEDVNELPGSSFPPEPVPPALGIKLQKVAAMSIPTPGPRSPSRIVISAINVDWPIVPGDSWEQLKQGIGHHVGSANPGERGNLVLSGHDDVYGEPFRDLEKLEIGKEVVVYAGATQYRYVIKTRRIVAPNDLSVLEPARSPIITLITCTPYRVDSQRLILIGDLKP
jgi:sortase A